MLSNQTSEFCERWLKKAEDYKCGQEHPLAHCFDRFFTLYVVYNRLYAQVASILEDRGCVNLDRRDYFPDREAATEYVLQYIGAGRFFDELEDDEQCREAIAQIIRILEENRFNLKLTRVRGQRQRNADLELLSDLQGNRATKSRGLLEAVYAVRCNMFHGHKQFQPAQRVLLEPVTTLLEKITRLLYRELSTQP